MALYTTLKKSTIFVMLVLRAKKVMAHISILSKVAYYGNYIAKYKACTNKTEIDAGRLGEKSQYKISTLTKIEVGVVAELSVQRIQKIAKSLGVPIEELLK